MSSTSLSRAKTSRFSRRRSTFPPPARNHDIVASRREKRKPNRLLPFRATVSKEENSLGRRHASLRRKASTATYSFFRFFLLSPFVPLPALLVLRTMRTIHSSSLSFSLFFVPVLIDISSVAEAHCFLRFHYRHLCAPPIRTKRHFRRHSPRVCAPVLFVESLLLERYLHQREREKGSTISGASADDYQLSRARKQKKAEKKADGVSCPRPTTIGPRYVGRRNRDKIQRFSRENLRCTTAAHPRMELRENQEGEGEVRIERR